MADFTPVPSNGTPQSPTSPSTGTNASGVAGAPETYAPTDQEKEIVAEIDRKYTAWLADRQRHEPQWYINSAMWRGQADVSWSSIDNRLINTPVLNPNRARRKVNRIFAKVRARRAKFLQGRPTWVVVPANTDIKDKMDARATGKVLDYVWRKTHLEAKYREARIWAEKCGRGYWWFYWDPDLMGRVLTEDPNAAQNPGAAPKKTVQTAILGDVCVEVGSPFEVLVGDPGASSLTTQNEIIRAKERSLDYIRARFPDTGQFVAAEGSGDVFRYEAQIAALSPTTGMFGSTGYDSSKSRDSAGQPNSAVVKEYFRRPTADLPQGKYCVVANGVLLKQEDSLPYGFGDFENPFPCVEFCDLTDAGQYWTTTMLEQLIDLQREYNGVRSMVSTHIKLMGFPKVFVAKQHQIPEGAWTPDAGEIIEYNARPGIPEPKPWVPPNIVADAWRIIDLIKTEFDDITQIYPSVEGKAGQSQSGFQTNLLQEAADSVHAPDIRQDEMSIEDAAFKVRRMIKLGYKIERLITIASGSYEPEMLEFSSDDVDEFADIVVQTGSALPMLKTARIQAALDLYGKGILGDPADPNVRRRLLNVIDLGGIDDILEYNRIDDDMINIENAAAEDGAPLAAPRFFENHQAHWTGHINRLKSPAVMNWPPPARMGLLAHAILHAMYMNHAAAYQMSIEAGLEGLVPPPPPPPTLPDGTLAPPPSGMAPPGGGAQFGGPPSGAPNTPAHQPSQLGPPKPAGPTSSTPPAQAGQPAQPASGPGPGPTTS